MIDNSSDHGFVRGVANIPRPQSFVMCSRFIMCSASDALRNCFTKGQKAVPPRAKVEREN